jgi:hypothetical protein
MSTYVIGEIGLQGDKIVEVSIECGDAIEEGSPFQKYECVTQPVGEVVRWIKAGDIVEAVSHAQPKQIAAVEVVKISDGSETIRTVQTGQPGALQLNSLPSYQVQAA